MAVRSNHTIYLESDKVNYHINCLSLSETGRLTTTALFLPYWGGTSRTFNLILQSLASNINFNCITVSYPGTGEAATSENDHPSVHSIESKASQVRQLLADPAICNIIGHKRLLICAHSMSAKVAYELLAQMIETPTSSDPEISSLLLLAPAPVAPLVLPEEMRSQQLSAYDSQETAEWTVQNILTTGSLSHDLLVRTAEDCTRMSSGAKAGWLQHGMQHDCTSSVNAIAKHVAEFKVHVLVGEKDLVETVERVQEGTYQVLERYGLNVTFSMAPATGHLLPLEAPHQVAETLRMLLD